MTSKPLPIWVVGSGAFALAFTGATYAIKPNAIGKAELRREWTKRTADQHYSGCAQARGNEDIG